MSIASAVVLAAACGGQASRAPTHAPGASMCVQPSDCRLAWTEDDVCGCCGTPRRGHAEALPVNEANERMSIGCPACACDPDPTLFATCRAGACEVVDLETSELTACDTSADCIAVPGTCGPATAIVAVRRGAEARLSSALGCAPRAPASSGGRAVCAAGHCRLAPPDVPAPVSVEGPAAASLPSRGRVGACELRITSSEAMRSWQMVVGVEGSPDEFSRVLVLVSITARCSTDSVVSMDGWLESGTDRFPLHYELRGSSSHTIVEGVLEANRDVGLDVVAIDAPFLTAPTVRAVVRARLGDGTTLLLATPELTVRQVS